MKCLISRLLVIVSGLCIVNIALAESLPLSTAVDKKTLLKGGYAKHFIQSDMALSDEQQDEIRYVDITFFYATNLLEELNQEEIQAYIEEQTGFANLALENINVELRRRVVFVGKLDIENANTSDLQHLYNAFFFDDVSANIQSFDFRADYRTLIRKRMDTQLCGKGNLPGNVAVIEVGQGCFHPSLLAHEWGHNDGMAHDITAADSSPLTPYGYGYQCDNRGTIMNTTLSSSTRHTFYSSPNILVNGDPCGLDGVADNTRLLQERMEVAEEQFILDFSNPRDPMDIHGTASFSNPPELNIYPSLGNIRFTLKRDGDLEPLDSEGNPQPISVEFYTKALSAIPGQDYEITIQRVEFAPGQEFAEVEIPLIDDPRSRNTVQFEVGLRYPLSLEVTSEPVVVNLLSERPFTGNAAFSSGNQSVTASSTSLSITVNRTGSTAGELLMPWFIQDVTTTSGDYSPGMGELVFADGEDSKTIELELPNPNQTTQRQFKVILDSADAIAPNELLVTIAASTPPQDNNSDGGSDSGGGGSLGWAMLLIAMLGLRRRQ